MQEIRRLWKISKYAYQEIFIDTQLQMAGSTQSKLMEEMEKNRRYMKLQEITMKIVLVLYVAGLIVFPLQIFSKIDEAIQTSVPLEWIIFAGSLLFMIFFLSQFLIILTFGLLQASGLLSGKHFAWLSTLPLSNRQLQKISFFTFFRGIDAQIIALFFILPIGVIIKTQNIFLILASFFLSIISVLFCFSSLILIGEKLQRILDENTVSSRKTNSIRMLVMGSYLVVLIIGALGIQLSFLYIESLFTFPPADIQLYSILNHIFPIISFPCSGGYLIIMLYLSPSTFSVFSIIETIVGVIFLVYLTYWIFRKSLKTLQNAITLKSEHEISIKTILTINDIQISTRTPLIAFFNKDKRYASRDLQVAMMFIMPIILPFLSLISVIAMTLEDELATESLILTNFSMNFMYIIMSAIIIIYGLLSIETTGQTIIGSLPIRIRDQANAKVLWMFIILLISSLIQILIFIGNSIFFANFILTITSVPFAIILGIFTLEMKVFLFGKLEYKYVLEDVKIHRKVWKWFLIILVDTVIYSLIMGIIAIFQINYLDHYLLYSSITMCLLFIILSIPVYYIYNRMFPK